MYAALSSLRVVEIGVGVAAAICGRYLADYGASVTTVRAPLPPSGFQPRGAHDDPAAVRRRDAYLHAGKEVVDIEFDAAGWETLRELIQEAEVLVEAMPVGFLTEHGFGPDELRAADPSLVYVSITPFGARGPNSRWHASEIVVDAAGGWMYGIGAPDREPLKPPGEQAQVLAGILAATAALGAWLGARADGAGDFVDVSMQEAVTFFLMNPTTVEEYSGAVWTRDGGVSGVNYPQGVLPCKD